MVVSKKVKTLEAEKKAKEAYKDFIAYLKSKKVVSKYELYDFFQEHRISRYKALELIGGLIGLGVIRYILYGRMMLLTLADNKAEEKVNEFADKFWHIFT